MMCVTYWQTVPSVNCLTEKADWLKALWVLHNPLFLQTLPLDVSSCVFVKLTCELSHRQLHSCIYLLIRQSWMNWRSSRWRWCNTSTYKVKKKRWMNICRRLFSGGKPSSAATILPTCFTDNSSCFGWRNPLSHTDRSSLSLSRRVSTCQHLSGG